MFRREFLKKTITASLGLPFIAMGGKGENEPASPTLTPNPAEWKDSEINIAWLGHSSVLMNLYGKVILTDPVLFGQIGLYMLGMTLGPLRYSAPALQAEEIPRPDIILLSHAHMDHMDYKTLDTITSRFPGKIDCLTAFNTMDIIDNLEWKSLQELDWGNSKNLSGVNFKALQVRHFGWRYPWERDRSKGFFENGRSYNAYILERHGKKILFGGDTAYTDLFSKSGEEVDIAIMPIGAYYPWRMNHCSPEEALRMANDVKAKVFLPIHCLTFKQGTEPTGEPMQRLLASLPNYSISLGIQNIGETYRTA